jgi:large subunit ribosomal protein L9
MGDVVQVKSGYARNYLLPKRLALRATDKERAFFETQKEKLAAQYLEQQGAARIMADSLSGRWATIVRQASEKGGLYGSVTHRDIAEALEGIVSRSQIVLPQALKEVGVFEIAVSFHAEVQTTIFVNIAPSKEEAEAQKQRYLQAKNPQAEEETEIP